MEILLFALCAMSFMIAWSYFQQLLKPDLGVKSPSAAETMSVVSWAYSWTLLGFNYILLYFNLHNFFGGMFSGLPEIISGMVTLHFVAVAVYARARYQKEPYATMMVRVTELLLRVFSVLFASVAFLLLRMFPDTHAANLTFSGSAIPDTFFQIWMILTALALTVIMPRTRSHIILVWAGLSLLIGAMASFLGYHNLVPFLSHGVGSMIGWAGSLVGIFLAAFRGVIVVPYPKSHY